MSLSYFDTFYNILLKCYNDDICKFAGLICCKMSSKFYVLLFCNLFIAQLCLSELQCVDNCSSVSGPSLSPNLCSVQYQKCPIDLSRGTPIRPKLTSSGFYLYDDPMTSECKNIALNFSWIPEETVATQLLQGYRVEIKTDVGVDYEKYFCFGNYSSSFNFYYDCFNMDDRIRRGQDFDVTITPLPERINPLRLGDFCKEEILCFNISIPECDEDERMTEVCQCYWPRQLTVDRINQSCINRSVEFFYNVPEVYGPTAFVELKEPHSSASIYSDDGLPLSGSLTINLSLYNNTDGYVVRIGGDFLGPVHVKNVSFSHCNMHADVPPMSLALIVSLPLVGFFIIVIIAAVICKAMRFNKNVQNLYESIMAQHAQHFMMDINTFNNSSENSTKIYVLFVRDHSCHVKLIEVFARYLQGDLGFDVSCEIYKQGEIFEDPIGWMEKSFDESDKIIVVWSPGASRRWNQYNNGQIMEIDMFSPVLKKIQRNIFRNKNLDKYFFVYFEYCSEVDIPIDFQNSSLRLFKLMQQFEDLYFQLRNTEMYMPGLVLKEEKAAMDTYYDPKLSKYGPMLKRHINALSKYTKEHPNWHFEHESRIELESESDNSQRVIKKVNFTDNVTSSLPLAPIVHISDISVGKPLLNSSVKREASLTTSANQQAKNPNIPLATSLPQLAEADDIAKVSGDLQIDSGYSSYLSTSDVDNQLQT